MKRQTIWAIEAEGPDSGQRRIVRSRLFFSKEAAMNSSVWMRVLDVSLSCRAVQFARVKRNRRK